MKKKRKKKSKDESGPGRNCPKIRVPRKKTLIINKTITNIKSQILSNRRGARPTNPKVPKSTPRGDP